MTGREALDQEARAWVRLLLSGAATRADARALANWRALGPDQEAAYARAALAHRYARDAIAELRDERSSMAARRPPRLREPSRRLVIGAAAAASVGGVALLVGRGAGVGPLAPEADFETGKGQTRRLDLGGSASVELTTLTRIALRPEAGRDALELLAGEVVASLPVLRLAPLAVLAGAGRVLASHGRFALRKTSRGAVASCLEGRCELWLGDARTLLRAHQAVAWTGERVGEIVSVDPDLVESWRRGVLVFRNRPLGDVIEEINRYRSGRIILTNRRLAARRVSGTFYLAALDQIVDQMRLAYGARVSRLPGGVVLVS